MASADLSNLTPELLSQLAAMVQGVMPTPDKPKQPETVVCWDAVTGEQKKLYRIDFKEQVARGDVVTDPSQVKGATADSVARARADAAVNPTGNPNAGGDPFRSALEALEPEVLRERWKLLHGGEEPHPRMGKARLVDEVLAAMVNPLVATKPADDGKTGEDAADKEKGKA